MWQAFSLPCLSLVQDETLWLVLFMAFQFCNGVCAACAFSIFCFELNNVERLFGMALIQLYYGFYYTVWRAFPAVQAAGKTWAAGVVMAFYLVVVFACARRRHEGLLAAAGDGKGSAVPFVIGLDMVYYMIMCMINYIEYAENSVSSLAFGLGAFISVALIMIIQLRNNRNALYVWLLFLALSLLGLGALLYDSSVTLISGSFAYGLGDGLGYIIIYYICAAAIKRSKSFKMFRLYCTMFFVQYFVISGAFSMLFKYFEEPNKVLAFAIVLVLGCLCLLLMPLMQKKLFDIDWTDGLHLRNIEEYSVSLSGVEAIDTKDNLNLTSREQDIFTILLAGKAPKEIAYVLKVSYDTVLFHQKNLYRKLEVQSRAELFARYSTSA
jgi:DNA-binding CsgD family transcriptional regulator